MKGRFLNTNVEFLYSETIMIECISITKWSTSVSSFHLEFTQPNASKLSSEHSFKIQYKMGKGRVEKYGPNGDSGEELGKGNSTLGSLWS